LIFDLEDLLPCIGGSGAAYEDGNQFVAFLYRRNDAFTSDHPKEENEPLINTD
jgi:hypothetical protein